MTFKKNPQQPGDGVAAYTDNQPFAAATEQPQPNAESTNQVSEPYAAAPQQPGGRDLSYPDINPADAQSLLDDIGRGADIYTNPWAVPGDEETLLRGLNPFLQELIKEFAAAKNVPISYYISAICAAVSAAAGSHIYTHWDVYDTLLGVFAVLIAPSTSGKSKADDDIMQYLDDKDFELRDRSQTARREYEEQCAALAKSKDVAAMPPKPKEECLIIDDLTEEKRNTILKDNPNGTFLHCGELAAIWLRKDRYNKGSETQNLIQIWENKPLRVDRVNRESDIVKRPYMAMYGTTQPKVAAKHLATEEGYYSGLTPRYLMFMEKNRNYKRNKGVKDLAHARRTWHFIIDRIFNARTIERELIPSRGALEIHTQFLDESEIIKQAADEQDNEIEGAIAGKIEINVWKLAGIAHLLNEAAISLVKPQQTDVITAEDMIWAVEVCKFSYRSQMALLELSGFANPKQKPITDKDLARIIRERYPNKSQAEIARFLEINPNTMRSYKNREPGR